MKSKRLIAAFIGLLAGFALAEQSELDRRIAALKAAGEPITIEDFKAPVIDPRDNAAIDIEEAVKVLQQETPEYNALDMRDETVRIPLTDFEIEKLLQIGKQNESALKLLAAAATKPHNYPPIDQKSPAILTLLPGLNGARACANLLSYEAFNQFGMGHYDAALDRLLQLSVLSDYTSANQYLVGMLVATGINAMQCMRLYEMAPELVIGNEADAIPRSKIQNLIAQLMDQSKQRTRFLRAIQAERYGSVDSLVQLLRGSMTPEQLGEIEKYTKLTPPKTLEERQLFELNAVYLLDYYQEYLKQIDADDYPAMKKQLAESAILKEFARDRKNPQRAIANTIMPSLDRVHMTHYGQLVNREAAAAALAIKLFRIDHNDQFPGKLEDLVPNYLPRLPRDYLAGNKPLSYRAGDKPILWSVWYDGKENSGKTREENKGSKEFDWVIPLSVSPRMDAVN